MDKMTNDERQEIAERLLEVMKILDNNMEMMGQAKLNDLYLDLTKSEREYPTDRKYLTREVYPNDLQFRSSGYPNTIEHRSVLIFTEYATPADRRMFEKARESYEDDKTMLGLKSLSGWDFYKRTQRRINYIETGADNESPK